MFPGVVLDFLIVLHFDGQERGKNSIIISYYQSSLIIFFKNNNHVAFFNSLNFIFVKNIYI